MAQIAAELGEGQKNLGRVRDYSRRHVLVALAYCQSLLGSNSFHQMTDRSKIINRFACQSFLEKVHATMRCRGTSRRFPVWLKGMTDTAVMSSGTWREDSLIMRRVRIEFSKLESSVFPFLRVMKSGT
jgi:hypothetical protein